MPGRPTLRCRAIVLDTTKLAEQDLILTLLSDSGAQLRAVAKGARKPGGRLAARAELFCESDFLLARGRNLDIVSEALVVNAHAGLRGDIERVSGASVVCELARLTCYEDAEDPYLLPLCERALSACEEARDFAQLLLVVAAYAFKICAHGGWRPELAACLMCGDPEPTWFSPAAGGVLCESCVRDVAGAVPLEPGELAWLRALIGATFDELMATETPERLTRRLAGFAHGWAETQLDARLRAFEFLLGL